MTRATAPMTSPESVARRLPLLATREGEGDDYLVGTPLDWFAVERDIDPEDANSEVESRGIRAVTVVVRFDGGPLVHPNLEVVATLGHPVAERVEGRDRDRRREVGELDTRRYNRPRHSRVGIPRLHRARKGGAGYRCP